MANANLTMGINGVDKTAAAFNSVKNRARATGAQIRSIMGGAIAAAGAYLSFRSIKSGIEEMSQLSDIAMKANASAGEIRQLSQALGVLGIQGAGVESIAQSFAMMEKNTGRQGLRGFYDTIAEIGKIEGASEKAKAAVAAFGRSGLNFMPLINAANESTAALEGVVGAFGKISDAHAAAADDINDGVQELTGTFKDLWFEALGEVAVWIAGEQFGGSVRQSMMAMSKWLRYWAHNAADILISPFMAIKRTFTSFYSAAGALAGSIYEGTFGSGGTWSDAWENVKNAFMSEWEEFGEDWEEMEQRMQDRADNLAAELEGVRNFQKNYNDATKGGSKGGEKTAAQSAGEAIGTAAAKAATRVTNQLMMGGSSAANRLAILGPEYQNEAKKQTDLLRKIAENTEKTAENTDEASEGYASTDLN